MACITDFKSDDGNWVKYASGNRQTLSYSKWCNIRGRCLAGGAVQKRSSTYVGCTMSDTFQSFQSFTNWHTEQIGYGMNYDIDKDILIFGNKIYSEEFCVLVPKPLNSFLVHQGGNRGLYPLGVSYNKNKARGKKFMSSYCKDGKCYTIGYFDTPEEAHAAYKIAKEAEARRWYERLVAGEFLVDPRVIERMRTWTLPEGL